MNWEGKWKLIEYGLTQNDENDSEFEGDQLLGVLHKRVFCVCLAVYIHTKPKRGNHIHRVIPERPVKGNMPVVLYLLDISAAGTTNVRITQGSGKGCVNINLLDFLLFEFNSFPLICFGFKSF